MNARRAIAIAASLALVAIAAVTAGACNTQNCATDLDCNTGDVCVYKVGSCSALGECKGQPQGAQCTLLTPQCGCPGAPSYTGCGFPDGYASLPTTGTPNLSLCTDAGTPEASATSVDASAE